MKKAVQGGIIVGGILTVVVFGMKETTGKKALQMCTKYCESHNGAEIRPTGKEIDGKPHVECWCKTKQGWRRNRTDTRLTK